MRSNFNERKNSREKRYSDIAENAKIESRKAFTASDEAVANIPMGQPILVGHHSEKRHRKALHKSHNAMRKGFELEKKAEYFESRAKAVAANKAIFSDDPAAGEKLSEKIERLESRQNLMREANKAVRKKDDAKLLELGFSETQVEALKKPDFGGRIGFAGYLLTNNGANIRSLKKRLEQVTALAGLETTETTLENGVRIIENAEDNRTQIVFPIVRVNPDLYRKLKQHGFRLTREGIWQRHISNAAKYWAEEIAKEFAE